MTAGEICALLAGERAAERVVRAVRDGFADTDRLLAEFVAVAGDGGQAVRVTPALRGFSRALQKRLEQSAAR